MPQIPNFLSLLQSRRFLRCLLVFFPNFYMDWRVEYFGGFVTWTHRTSHKFSVSGIWNTHNCICLSLPSYPNDWGLSFAPVQLDTLCLHALVPFAHTNRKINRVRTPGDHRWIYIRCEYHRSLPTVYYLKIKGDILTLEKIWRWISQKTEWEGNYDLTGFLCQKKKVGYSAVAKLVKTQLQRIPTTVDTSLWVSRFRATVLQSELYSI